MKKNIIGILEFILLTSILLAPLSLLSVDGSLLFPYITSKNFWWREFITIAFAAWASLALLDVRYRVRLNHPILISFSLFMLVMFCANILGLDPYRSFWSNAERMDGYVGLLHMFMFFISLLGLVKASAQNKESIVPNILWSILFILIAAAGFNKVFSPAVGGEVAGLWFVGGLIMAGLTSMPAWHKPTMLKTFVHAILSLGAWFAVIAIAQDSTRADAILGNPIYLASFSSFCVFFATYYMTRRDVLFKKMWLKEITYIALILLYIWAIFESATRGAILGLFFGGLTTAALVSITARDTADRLWRRLGIMSFVILAIICGSFFTFKEQIKNSSLSDGHLLKRAAHFSLEDQTTKHRLSNWGIAVDGSKERPILGYGQENYIDVFSAYYRPNELHDAEQWFDRTHNMFLDWLVFGGYVGLISFIALLGVALWMLWSASTSTARMGACVLSGTVVAYAAQNFVAFDALATGMLFTTLLVLISHTSEGQQKSSQHIKISETVNYLFITVIWISALVWIWYSVIVPKQTIRDFMSLMYPINPQANIDQVMTEHYDRLERALSKNHLFQQEILEQLMSQPQLFIHKGMSSELQGKFISLLSKHVGEYMSTYPHKTRIPLFYGSLMTRLQQHDAAEQMFSRALETSPKKLSILMQLSQNALQRGDGKAALLYAQTAADLAPNSEATQKFNQQIQSTQTQ